MIKTILLYIGVIILSLTTTQKSHSAIHIVSNNPQIKAEYRSIQSALEFAHPYDTIMVMGSPINYGNVIIEKPVVLMGEGFSENNNSGHSTKITRILLTSNAFRRTISSGTQIMGFEFPYFPGERPNIITATLPNDISIDNIVLEKNWFWFLHIIGNSQNWTLRNNIIRGWVHGGHTPEKGVDGAKNFTIENNIITSLRNFHETESIIRNNVFLGRLQNVNQARFENNIFASEDYIFDNVYSCHFSNNIAYSEIIGRECYQQNNSFEAHNSCISKKNSGSRNLVGVDPGFVLWPVRDIEGGKVFQLTDESIARKPGVQKNELGIYGGSHPFPYQMFKSQEIMDPFPAFVTSVK